MMSGDEYIAFVTEFVNNSGGNASEIAEINSYGNANTNWLDEVSQIGLVQGHNISFTGGKAENNYYVSANLLDQEGVIKDTDFKRISIRANLKNTLNKSMVLNSNFSLSQTKSNGFLQSDGTNTRNFGKSGIGSALLAVPTVPVYDANGNFSSVLPYSFNDANVENPVGIQNALDRNRLNKANVVLSLTTKFSDNLSNTTRASADYSERRYDFYSPSYLTQIGSQIANLNTISKLNTLFESFFNYNKTFREFEVNALVGSSLAEESSEAISLTAAGFPTDELENNAFQSASSNGVPFTFNAGQSLASFFTRIRLNINKKYLITLNARTDGSSVFAANNKWAKFGAIGGAWRVSKEDFMQGSVFNDLKLRLSTGSTGNQSIKAYQSLLLGKNVLTGQTAGAGIAVGLAPNLPNPNLTWETTSQTNFGIDAALYQNKYRMSLDIYKKVTNDLLANVSLPPSSGFSNILSNNGKIENKGIEIQFGTDLIDNRDLKLSINSQFSVNKNVVLQTNNGEDIFSTITGNDTSRATTIIREGESIFSLYGFKSIGFDENGLALFEDLDGDGIPDEQIIGSTLPDFTYGFNTSLSYKKWTLDTNWQGVSGNKVANTTVRDLTQLNTGWNRLKNIRDYWPVISNVNIDTGQFLSDRYVEDGSFLRLANVKLNYNFNSDSISFADSINIYASGQNLLIITNYTGFDPEVNSFSGSDARQGIDLGGYPTARTFTLGLNVSF